MKNFTFTAILFGLFTFISCGTAMDPEQDRAATVQTPDEGGTTVERPLDTRNPNRSSLSRTQEQQVQHRQQTQVQHRQQTQEQQPHAQFIQQYNQNMYTDLNMTDEQIRQFETRDKEYMRSTTDVHQANRAEMLRQRNENLRSVLNPSQFTKYQQWVIDNPPGF